MTLIQSLSFGINVYMYIKRMPIRLTGVCLLSPENSRNGHVTSEKCGDTMAADGDSGDAGDLFDTERLNEHVLITGDKLFMAGGADSKLDPWSSTAQHIATLTHGFDDDFVPTAVTSTSATMSAVSDGTMDVHQYFDSEDHNEIFKTVPGQ